MAPRQAMAGIRALQHSVSLALLEFVLLGTIYAADWLHHVFPRKVPYLLALAWISLRLQRVGPCLGVGECGLRVVAL